MSAGQAYFPKGGSATPPGGVGEALFPGGFSPTPAGDVGKALFPGGADGLAAGAGYWDTPIVIDGTSLIGDVAMVVDDDGYYHAVFTGNDDLQYVTNSSGSWVSITIDGSGGRHQAIAIDSNGSLHVAYNDWTNTKLRYATNSSGSWVTTQTYYGMSRFEQCAIIVDSSDNPHICFSNSGYVHEAMYSDAEGWQWTTVALGNNPSMVIDADGVLRMVYVDADYDLWYTSAQTSGDTIPNIWTTPVEIDTGNIAIPTITIDENGAIHLAYRDDTSEVGLRYTTNASGAWVSQTVGLSSAYYPKIAVGSNDVPHIVYLDGSTLYHVIRPVSIFSEPVEVDYIGSVFAPVGMVAEGEDMAIAYLDESRVRYFAQYHHA